MKANKQTDNKSLVIDLDSMLSTLTQEDVNELIERIEQIKNNTPEQNKLLLDREGEQNVD